MDNSIQRNGTKRQWLENKAIMGTFALMKLLPYRLRHALMGACFRRLLGSTLGYRTALIINLP